jgi:predicted phosphodiesterase
VELGGKLFYLVHSVHDLDIDPVAAQVDVIISGHSHKPLIERKKGVMYLNPGSAGPRRFSLPVSVALLTVSPSQLESRIVELSVENASSM